MNYKQTRKQWLADLPRKKLNNYIKQCEKLFDEAQAQGNNHNIEIFALWLSDAVFEAKRRDHNKSIYLEQIKKKKII